MADLELKYAHLIDTERLGSDRRCYTEPIPVEGIANEHLHRRIHCRQFVLDLHHRILAKALIRLAPDDLSFVEIPIGNLPLYSQDYDADYPPEGRALKEAIAAADAILFVTPEYNRSIPGALKNAIDWASRPWGQNSFDHMPAAVIGASPGVIGTALGQQSLRAVLAYANARQMTAPEAYIRFKPEIYSDDGSVADDSTAQFLRNYMQEFRDHIQRVLTVLPRPH